MTEPIAQEAIRLDSVDEEAAQVDGRGREKVFVDEEISILIREFVVDCNLHAKPVTMVAINNYLAETVGQSFSRSTLQCILKKIGLNYGKG